tara:strand:+ start:131 stop:466 length:336 start_codon:yes stop_codon:yes gene_type:complete
MLIAQIVNENSEDIRTDIISLLDAISAEGLEEIKFVSLLKDLRRAGHTITRGQLLDVLQGVPIVRDASLETIRIVTDRDNDANIGDGEEKAKKQVKKLAQKRVNKELDNEL